MTHGDGRERVRPGMYTGTLPAAIFADGEQVGRLRLEVRSRKLDYLSHYRWMLRDLASQSAELLMMRFGPTEQRFQPTPEGEARTAYQRFTFLRAFVENESFRAAIGRIIAKPYVAWTESPELRPPNRGLPSSSTIARQLSRPGRRFLLGEPTVPGRPKSLPAQIEISRAEETLDNVPNRFVKFVLQRWSDELSAIEKSLMTLDLASAPAQRGLREIESIRTILDGLLSEELFREIGELTRLPSGNPVLLGREGYRDILDAYLKSDLAARLSWTGGDAVYGAGQRDVATLYEYWVYLRLGEIVSRLCREPFHFGSLIEPASDGLNLGLTRGDQRVMTGATVRFGRRLTLSLWFNRSFPHGAGPTTSWTRTLRPDFSLQVRCLDAAPLVQGDVWLHFDAKYRVDRLEQILGEEDENVLLSDDKEGAPTGARGADLLKMHAYRDAIRRSVGAYVIYPGSNPKTFQEYHEILPGLGAFGLRPTADGDPTGAGLLSRFIDDVINHSAAQLSQHERGRYWQQRVYDDPTTHVESVEFASFLDRPPADTKVLLGYVKSEAHLAWIRKQRRYNLRADKTRRGRVGLESRNLNTDLLLLYGPRLQRLGTLEDHRPTGSREQRNAHEDGVSRSRRRALFLSAHRTARC